MDWYIEWCAEVRRKPEIENKQIIGELEGERDVGVGGKGGEGERERGKAKEYIDAERRVRMRGLEDKKKSSYPMYVIESNKNKGHTK